MKMNQKLIALFSLLMFIATAANSLYFYHTRKEELNQSTYDSLNALGNKMLDEIEQYIQLMDYAMEQLTANVEFMNAFYTASMQEDEGDIGALVAVQTQMSRTLYQAPLIDEFYRVSVYSRNGFFLSNHFEKVNPVVSLSAEARETVATIPYLSRVDGTPFLRHLVAPHGDCWSSAGDVQVFSAVRAAIWHGQFIGYLEVSAQVEALTNIFHIPEMEGLLAQVIFDNGDQLFRSPGDPVVYTGLNPTGMTRYHLEDGNERLVIHLRSKLLGLNIYVSQDMSVYSRRVNELLLRNVTVACVTLLVTLFFITVFSFGLTRSIRRLTKKMLHLPVDDLMSHPNEALSTMVTSPWDKDIFHVERVFNDLIARLQVSHRIELSMREGALQAQLNALQMQINPHFVYNTLNLISAKGMESGNEGIIELCDQFAQMLRYSTDLHSKTATLGDELQNARRYLLLAKARYEDQLLFEIDVPARIESLIIPKLTLQPIVENALTHGFSMRTDQRRIAISGTEDQGMLRLTIRDNGNGFDEAVLSGLRESFRQIEQGKGPESAAEGNHIGLINTYLRLHYYSKGRIQMELCNDHGAVVKLLLPCGKEESHV